MKHLIGAKNTEDITFKEWSNIQCPAHCHPSFEAVLVLEGTFEIEKEKNIYLLSKNQVMLIMPYEIHKFRTPDTSHILVTEIMPEAIGAYNEFFRNKSPENPVCNISDEELEILKKNIENTNSAPHIYINAIFYNFMSLLGKNTQMVGFETPNDLLRTAVLYVHKNFEQDICLKDVANELNVSYAYISKLFSKTINMSFKDFINGLRLNKSISLLHNPDLSISQISYLCGWGSIRNFNRIFLEEMNCTPSQYRKNFKI